MSKFSKLFLGKSYLKIAFIILVIGLIGYFVIRGIGLKEGLDAPGDEEKIEKHNKCFNECPRDDDWNECMRTCTAR